MGYSASLCDVYIVLKVKNRSPPIRGRGNRLRERFKKPFGGIICMTPVRYGLNALHPICMRPRNPQKFFSPLEPKLLKIFSINFPNGGLSVTRQNRETHFDQSEPLIWRRRRMQTKISTKSKIQNF